MAQRAVTFAAKWRPDDLAEIKARAKEQDLTATEYVRRCALGLHTAESEIESRLRTIEGRLDLIEERAEASGW